MPRLILASSSIYRRALLERLRLPFITESPDIDESPLPGESPLHIAQRLAQEKALAVAAGHRQQLQETLVIGSDQVINLDSQALGKPQNHEEAVRQLRQMRGRQLWVYTAVAVVRCSDLKLQTALSSVSVSLRNYSDKEIETYLQLDKPYECAGAIKSESLGIALIERIDSQDPTALIGLPLTDTLRLLRFFGVDILAMAQAQS